MDVDREKLFNSMLVMVFREIEDAERRALITGNYKDISINDMHILEAIGVGKPKNMSAVAKAISVTVGTLTIAINNLVKKGYVRRVRSEEDKRVVLLSLTGKGRSAYESHAAFHKNMIRTVMEGFEENELDVLSRAFLKLRKYFRNL
ncbi:MAG: MarR family transcriptional regulator [Lachnospiraceae bacterium]|nr:MarR family transcriptional regulator [Lachnospiraceae bacterium]